jgi:PAS domain S-box-containing protein
MAKAPITTNTSNFLDETFQNVVSAFNFSPVAISINNIQDMSFIFVNRAFCTLVGYTTEEVIGKTADALNLVSKDSQGNVVQKVLSDNGKKEGLEIRIRKANGMYADVLNSIEKVNINGEDYWISAFIDITEQKKVEENTRYLNATLEKRVEKKALLIMESERKIRGFLNSTQEGIYTLDAHFNFDLINPMGALLLKKITGKDFKAGDNLLEHLTEARQLVWRKMYVQVKNGEQINYEIDYSYNGELTWLSVHLQPLRDHGEVVGMIVTTRDVSERKKAQDELFKANERFNLAVEASSDVIYDVDFERRKVDVNQAIKTLLGYPYGKDLDLDYMRESLHPDDRKKYLSDLDEFLQGDGRYFEHEHRLVSKTGAIVYVAMSALVSRRPDGKAYRMVGVLRNITQQKISENIIKESEHQLRVLINSISQLAWICDSEGNVEWYNERWYEYTGSNLDEMRNKGWINVQHPDHIDRVLATLEKAFEEKKPFEMSFPLKRYDGQFRWFLTRVYPVFDSVSHALRWIGTNTDIDDQVRFTEKLEFMVKQRTAELQHSNEDLQQFAHVASHDLKEPVRKIKIFSGRLEEDTESHFSENGKRYLEKIQHAANRIYDMIEGVLSYSIPNSSIEDVETVDLNDVIREIETDLELLTQQKNATLIYDQLPVVKGEPILVYQLFYNLINNALKFSKPSEPPVIEIILFESNGGFVEIIVRDNGIGFEQDKAEKIFDTFIRLNSKDKYEGTGLGLSLCKRIVERHGGKIEAAGIPGKGADIRFTLPAIDQNSSQ